MRPPVLRFQHTQNKEPLRGDIQLVKLVAKRTFFTISVLYSPIVSADMGPMIVVPIGVAILIQLTLLIVLISPARMRDRRVATSAVFTGILLIPWLIFMSISVNEYADFLPLFLSIFATFAVLYGIYYKRG